MTATQPDTETLVKTVRRRLLLGTHERHDDIPTRAAADSALDALAARLAEAETERVRLRAELNAFTARVAALEAALTRIATAVEAWDNDETPDEDFPFDADMDFVNFCGYVARAALDPAPSQPAQPDEEGR